MTGVQRTVALLLGIIVLILGLLVARVMREPPITAEQLARQNLVLINPGRALQTFSLTDQHNRPFVNSRLEGRWSLVFFGYTDCPDICPTTLSLLNRLKTKLDSAGVEPPVQYILVTVDPQRDTPERLADYLSHYNPQFIGLGGSIEAIFAFARDLNSSFARASLNDGNYRMDHSAYIALINPEGEYHGFFRAPHDIMTMENSFRAMLKGVTF